MENNKNLTQSQKNKLLTAAEIVSNGDFAVIQKLFEYEDYLNNFKDEFNSINQDVKLVKDKIDEIKAFFDQNISSVNNEISTHIQNVMYLIDELELKINDKINESDKKTLSQFKEISQKLTSEISRIEDKIPSIPEVDLSYLENRISEVESKIPVLQETIVETGESIVDKINNLPTDEEINKIGIEHISGLQKEINDIRFRISNINSSNSGRGFGQGGGLSQVYHDSTLSGLGTQSSPLRVLGGGTWYQDEIIASGVTGTVFNLVNTPTNIVFLYLNGQYLISGVGRDYTRSGKTITLATSLLSTDVLTANYS